MPVQIPPSEGLADELLLEELLEELPDELLLLEELLEELVDELLLLEELLVEELLEELLLNEELLVEPPPAPGGSFPPPHAARPAASIIEREKRIPVRRIPTFFIECSWPQLILS